jgi:hypothetical protein
MRRHVITALAASAVLAVAAPVAAAATAGSETITMNWSTPYVTGAPWTTNGTGSFSASSASGPSDTGTLSVASHLGGVSSPSLLNLHSDRTLSDASGNTITLRCNEIAFNFTNAAAIPVTGNCTVIAATGAFSGLHGEGALTGTGDTTGPNAALLSEVLTLSTR